MEQECVRFCEGCSLIPRKTRAKLTGAEVLGPELPRYRFARESPELREHFAPRTRVHAEITESSDPDIEIGSTAAIIVNTNGEGYQGVRNLIKACKGRVPTNWLQRLLRIRTRCGALDNRFNA